MIETSENYAGAHYKEYIAQLDKLYVSESTHIDVNGKLISEYGCSDWALTGSCEYIGCDNKEIYARSIVCGREWCPDCGQKGSHMHMRRISKMYPKAQTFDSMAYLVIEFPLVSRDKYRTKKALSKIGVKTRRSLKKYGYDRGLMRWHYFGEMGIERGYNPHMNILVEGDFLNSSELDNLKTYLRNELNESDLIVNYSYRRSAAEKFHTLKYVNRATFLNESWDYELASELHNFRSGQGWGSVEAWTRPIAWSIDEKEKEVSKCNTVEKLERGVCPCCENKLTWTHFERSIDDNGQVIQKSVPNLVPVVFLEILGFEHIAAGYYRCMPSDNNEPEHLADDVVKRVENYLFGLKMVANNIAVSKKYEPNKYTFVHPAVLYREYMKGQGENYSMAMAEFMYYENLFNIRREANKNN